MVRERESPLAPGAVDPESLPHRRERRLARVVAKRCPDCGDLKLAHVDGPPLAFDHDLGALIVVSACRICGCQRYLIGGGNVDVDEFPEWRRGL